jgi:TM2 domain-containing membrane protein YozV
MSQGYKNPFMMLLISVFWGVLGVDRFLLGQVSIGVLKLLTGGACGIMWIIDMIKIQDMTRDYNYKKLLGLHS